VAVRKRSSYDKEMIDNNDKDDFPVRKNIRLKGFDYSLRRDYFVTIVAHQRRKYFADKRIADSTINGLLEQRQTRNFKLYVYCLMPDHFHAIFGTGESGLSLGAICGGFKGVTTNAFWQWGNGRLWQKRFFDHIIRNEAEFWETVAYIRNNPVRKGLVGNWEDYSYTGSVDL